MIETAQLGEVLAVRKGRRAFTVRREQASGAKPYIQIDEVRGATPRLFASDPQGVDIARDDLCIVLHGPQAGTVRYGLDGFIGNTVARMRLRAPEEWDTRFIGRFLQSSFRQLNGHARARGATIPHVDTSTLEAIPVPRIPVGEQRHIAAILDKADDIRCKRERLRNLTMDFLKSAYLHTLGHLHPHYEEWDPVTIEALAATRRGAIRAGPLAGAMRQGDGADEGIAVLDIANAAHNTFSWGTRRFIAATQYRRLGRYEVFPNDVIVTLMGVVGRSAVVPGGVRDAVPTNRLAAITCDTRKILPEILSFAIHSDPSIVRQIHGHNRGARAKRLTVGTIKRLTLRRPPLDAQFAFRDILNRTNSLVANGNAPRIGVGILFASLSQRAFRGQL